MEDLYDDRDLGRILVALQARMAPVATVCHGTIGLLSARPEGTWIFAGYQMTGYTDEEEPRAAPVTPRRSHWSQGCAPRAPASPQAHPGASSRSPTGT
jgi:putative intracellular protease/amidase